MILGLIFAVGAVIAKPDYHSGDGMVYKTDPSMIAVTNSYPGPE